jgi:hypothetical protein
MRKGQWLTRWHRSLIAGVGIKPFRACRRDQRWVSLSDHCSLRGQHEPQQRVGCEPGLASPRGHAGSAAIRPRWSIRGYALLGCRGLAKPLTALTTLRISPTAWQRVLGGHGDASRSGYPLPRCATPTLGSQRRNRSRLRCDELSLVAHERGVVDAGQFPSLPAPRDPSNC